MKPRPIVDFRSPDLAGTYGGRPVDPEWANTFRARAGNLSGIVADLGSGGGLYSLELAKLGPKLVLSIDLSMSALASSPTRSASGDVPIARIQSAIEALALAPQVAEAVVCRAVIHHWPSLRAGFAEAFRILDRQGFVWIQDRTHQDVERGGSQNHIRGWFLEIFPKLAAIERSRRYTIEEVTEPLRSASFVDVDVFQIFETRATFSNQEELTHDIVSRHGRSLLHALTDEECEALAKEVCSRITTWPVVDRDRWTVWTGRCS